ncbi:MAG: multiheme c-type cytochrome [Planctomycetota bacterium]
MRRTTRLAMVWFLGAVAPLLAQHGGVQQDHPIFVGARVCARCHSGAATGHQFSVWRLSKHAQAHATLWSEEAKQIAKLSGIPEEPQQAAMCLGCHATAWDAEPWERDDTFLFEDGVQCERCHGAGSEYMSAEVMMNRELAMRRGLKTPTERECVMCHKTKGSHVAVLRSPEFNLEESLKQIVHAVPEGGRTPVEPRLDLLVTEEQPGASSAATRNTPQPRSTEARYMGVHACAACHGGPMFGYQFSRWRLSPHAGAFVVLGTTQGYQFARQAGVMGDPQTCAKCLNCHTTGAGLPTAHFQPGFDFTDGVQCESCHGPGSEYSPEGIMRDSQAAMHAGLKEQSPATCMPCHEKAHGREFNYDMAVRKIAHPLRPEKVANEPRYKTPLNLALTPDGRELWVACEASGTVIVVGIATLGSRRVLAEIEVGGQATGVAFSPDGKWAFVSSRLDDAVAVVSVPERKVTARIPVGDEPHGVVVNGDGKRLYVANTSSDDISVVDTATLRELWRLQGNRQPWALALSPDGTRIAVTNNLSDFVPFREENRSEVTVIDATRGHVIRRSFAMATNLLQGLCWHPSGEFVLFTMNRTKGNVPMTRLLQGWTITNGLGILWQDGRIDQVLLDEPDIGFSDAADVAISPDGRWAFVTSTGTDRVAVVDVVKLVSMLQSASDYEREHVFPNHVGMPTEFVLKHVPTRRSPRGLTVAPDGKSVFVANSLDDSVTVIDVPSFAAVERIDLGGPKLITKIRWGEILFHSADITYHRQFSCHSCHPDGHVDGITYDIEPDGIGVNPVDNRTLRGIYDTAPFKWTGINPSLARQCGPRLSVFFTRLDPFTPEQLDALNDYTVTIPRPPNRYRPLGAELTPAQRRGRIIFERTRTNDGREIPEGLRCITCHFPPLYTDRLLHDVGTKLPMDTKDKFDTPHLNNIYDSAPYLHNGISPTLEEIWTRYNPYDTHGVTNDMTKDQLNDLVEYLKTL